MWSSLFSVILVINELMASNAGEVMSPAINFDSWIELYNPSDQAVNLGGMYLSDDAQNPMKWQMPDNMGSVPAKGFKVVWLGSNDIKNNQAPFKLDCDGSTIYLSDSKGELITSLTYPEALSRTAWARKTDGGDDWGWTAQPTPEATNATATFPDKRLAAPVVDQGSQLFSGSLRIKVEIPKGATLRYTINGSMPTAKSSLSTVGQFAISNTTNFVFRLFQDGYLPSPPVTRSYIKTNTKYTIPIVSIVGDETYFSDPKIGIDCDGDGTNGKTGNGQDQKRNYNMDWDRPVNFSYISPTEGMLFNQDVNVSISGGWTRSASPRSMKLKSNKVFDGLNHLDYPFFPQKPYIRNKVLLVRNGGNDAWNYHARFTDPALTTIIQRSGIDLDVQSTVQVAEFINGKFRGVLNLREPNNDKFAYANWGYDDEELDAFENKTFKNGDNEAYRHLCDISKDINRAGVYDEVKTLLDIDEFINYMAVELYLGNDDWPENNAKGYRSRNDGRFRFVCFDLDYTFHPWNRTISSLNTYAQENNDKVDMVVLFLNLLKHDEFRKQFIDTFCIVAGSVFERERAIAIVNELVDTMGPMSQLDGYTPDRAANNIKNKLQGWLGTKMSQLQQYQPMKLSNAKKQNVKITTDTEGANLYINGRNVPYADFNGQLFAPVTLEAKAPVGYTFAGWKKGTSASLQLIKDNDTWKYYDQGAAPSNWTAHDFNDNGWSSGQAPLGYKMAGVKTTVSYGDDPNRKHPTTYFRKAISLKSTPSRSDVFLLNYQVDDGFVVYVNGKEAGRFNMPSGNINFDSFSSSYADDTPLTGTLELSSSLFKSGSNVIAVEIHNNKYASGDQYWAAELFTSVGTTSEGIISSETVMNLPTDNALSLVACFTPLSDEEKVTQGLTPVRINEVSAANSIFVNDYWKHNDWVELYNTTDSPVNVEGMYLSDNLAKPKKYQISKGETLAETIIPAHGYLVVWCDKLDPVSQLHADFKLDADGGDMILTAADESWCDQITYTQHQGNESVGRYPDGHTDVFAMNIPTIARPNILSSYLTVVEQPQGAGIHDIMADATEQISVRYAEGCLTIRSMSADALQVRLTNLAGQSVMSLPVALTGGYAEVPVEQLSTGIFIATVTDHQGHKATCKFIKR
ncbi:MAG: lamin tail domain-containing protein [Prevotella sp.]|nr:lamin tail domain-containing protein [Prevotella sp.]